MASKYVIFRHVPCWADNVLAVRYIIAHFSLITFRISHPREMGHNFNNAKSQANQPTTFTTLTMPNYKAISPCIGPQHQQCQVTIQSVHASTALKLPIYKPVSPRIYIIKIVNIKGNQTIHRAITSTSPHYKAIGQIGLRRFLGARSVDDAACYGFVLNELKGTTIQMPQQRHNAT